MARKAGPVATEQSMGAGTACDEIARRALITEPKPGRQLPEDRVVDEFDKLSAYELCCILEAVKGRIGRDLPPTQLYKLTVRITVDLYQEMVDASA